MDPQGSSRLASVINMMGNLARQAGDLATAEDLLREGLAMRARILGERHPALTQAHLWMALTLAGRGNFAEAEEFARLSISIRAERMGEGHQQTTHSRKALADVLGMSGQADAARAVYLDCITRLETAPDDSRTLADECRRALAALGAP
jgi:hypothetical protein